MNRLPIERRAEVIRCLVEGCSIRSTVRITGVAKNSIQALTREVGQACLDYQDRVLRGLKCKRVQADEVWAFCYAKDKNLPDAMRGTPGVGSIWTWTALCAESKLLLSWRLGARDAANAHAFIRDVSERLGSRVQLTTDGCRVYLDAVADTFAEIDYAMLVKHYGPDQGDETRYSPGKCLGAQKRKMMGQPDEDHISTSYAERQNLNVRMGNRRYTRLTNAFSKKADMLAYSVAITFMYHNFARVHQTLRMTPAMKAGVDRHLWSVRDIVEMADAWRVTQERRAAGTAGRLSN